MTAGGDGRVKLTAGWRIFTLANKLQVGDISIFELINKQKFNVHILRLADAKENRENIAINIEEIE